MDRIINASEIILRDDELLLEVKVSNNKIIAPDTTEAITFDYLTVIAKGKGVDNFEIGDIVVDIQKQGIYGFKIKNVGYVKCPRHAVIIAVKPNNFSTSITTNLLN